MKSRKTGMSFKSYTAMCKASGDEPMDEKDFNALPEKDDDSEEAEKSDRTTVRDLLKSLDAYEAVEAALEGGGASRETYLMGRVTSGTISKSERSELSAIWDRRDGGGAAADRGAGGDIRKSLADTVEETPDGKRMIDASDFLKSLVDGVDASLDRVEATMSRESAASRQLLKAQGALIKGLAHEVLTIGNVNAALARRLGLVEREPVAPRARTADPRTVVNREIAKGGHGEDAPNTELKKSEVVAGLRALVIKADKAGDSLAIDKLADATASFETSGRLAPNIRDAIIAMRASA